jgi:hypothetical protein
MEHNLIDIPLDHYIQHNTRSWRRQDSQFLQIRHSANIFVYISGGDGGGAMGRPSPVTKRLSSV